MLPLDRPDLQGTRLKPCATAGSVVQPECRSVHRMLLTRRVLPARQAWPGPLRLSLGILKGGLAWSSLSTRIPSSLASAYCPGVSASPILAGSFLRKNRQQST